MKNQALFSSKDKSKKLKCHLLQFLFGALRVKTYRTLGETRIVIKDQDVVYRTVLKVFYIPHFCPLESNFLIHGLGILLIYTNYITGLCLLK